MFAALLFAVCIPLRTCGVSPCATPTPMLRGDHDRLHVSAYRVYAKRPSAATWEWTVDIPYHPADSNSVEAAPLILLDWPVQRLVPTNIQREEVDFSVRAISADGLSMSDFSSTERICMPGIWTGGPYN